MTLAGCGSSPTEPSVPTVQGVWRGTWNAQTCVVSGTVPQETCAFQSGTFVLRLNQSSGSLTGSMSVCGGQLSMTGEITQDGLIALVSQTPFDPVRPTTISVWDAGVNGSFLSGGLICRVQAGATPQDSFTMVVTLDNVALVSGDPNAVF